VRLRVYGDAAVLVDLSGHDEVLATAAALREDVPDGVVDVVPAARTVLVRFDRARTTADAVAAAVRSLRPRPMQQHGGQPEIELQVTYDGADLEEVARVTGLGVDGVVAAHTAGLWTVAFCGFVPGFGYLVGEQPQLRVARRADPRTRVPAGSVALADEYTGVYPRSSPGGWQLIGRTDRVLWDVNADPPALLRPGVRVRFVAVR
jgi:KipI family sensor histidine kinase inhibitor